jgi:hypothetical protein
MARESTRRKVAWILMLAADIGLLAWGALAALAPQWLPGPGSTQILPAGYEHFSGHVWKDLVASSPATAGFIEVLFRLYGAYIVAFCVMAILVANTAFRRGEAWAWWALLVGNTIAYGSAMTYDQIAGAIGPLEASEYLGIAAVYGALAMTWRRSGSSSS